MLVGSMWHFYAGIQQTLIIFKPKHSPSPISPFPVSNHYSTFILTFSRWLPHISKNSQFSFVSGLFYLTLSSSAPCSRKLQDFIMLWPDTLLCMSTTFSLSTHRLMATQAGSISQLLSIPLVCQEHSIWIERPGQRRTRCYSSSVFSILFSRGVVLIDIPIGSGCEFLLFLNLTNFCNFYNSHSTWREKIILICVIINNIGHRSYVCLELSVLFQKLSMMIGTS